MTDGLIVEIYRLWSDDTCCVGFLKPSPDTVQEFRGWLEQELRWDPAFASNDEKEMIAEFHRQAAISMAA